MKRRFFKKQSLALLMLAPFVAGAQITTAPNNATLGTAIPPTAFPSATNPTTPPSAFPPGTMIPAQNPWPDPLAPQRQSWQMQAPNAATLPPEPRTLSPTSTPTCNSFQANGQPCVQQ